MTRRSLFRSFFATPVAFVPPLSFTEPGKPVFQFHSPAEPAGPGSHDVTLHLAVPKGATLKLEAGERFTVHSVNIMPRWEDAPLEFRPTASARAFRTASPRIFWS